MINRKLQEASTTNSDNSELSWVTHHEAAHVVAAIRLGRSNQDGELTILPHGGNEGVHKDKNPIYQTNHRDKHGKRVPDTAKDNYDKAIIELYAGYYGGILADAPKDWERGGSSADYENISRYTEYAGTPRATLKKRAEKLVVENWKVIQKLAAELLITKHLDHTEVECIVKCADGQPHADADLKKHRKKIINLAELSN